MPTPRRVRRESGAAVVDSTSILPVLLNYDAASLIGVGVCGPRSFPPRDADASMDRRSVSSLP